MIIIILTPLSPPVAKNLWSVTYLLPLVFHSHTDHGTKKNCYCNPHCLYGLGERKEVRSQAPSSLSPPPPLLIAGLACPLPDSLLICYLAGYLGGKVPTTGLCRTRPVHPSSRLQTGGDEGPQGQEGGGCGCQETEGQEGPRTREGG